MSRDLTRSCELSVMRLYEQERLELSHHPPKFGGRKDCGRTDFNLPHDLSRPRGQSVM